MRTVVTADQMRALESACFSRGLRPIDAMERAAGAVADYLIKRLGPRALVHFACGPGNNGGDGFAAARLFADQGGRSVVVPMCVEARLKGAALENCLRAHQTPRVWFSDARKPSERPDAWVDALFGIGLSRPVDDACALLMRRIEADRRAGSLVVSVDVPTGLNSDTGLAMGPIVNADVTITFEHIKAGHVLAEGPEYCGELAVRGIGLDEEVPGAARLIEKDDLPGALPPRRRESHKNTYGHLLIVAGSFGMAGAALLSARAALRSGAGLVTVACPAPVATIIQAAEPCAICAALPHEAGVISHRALPEIAPLLEGKSAVAIGPGLSQAAPAGLVERVLSCGLPAVIDADALNILSANRALLSMLRPHHIITPHPGEAARLMGEKPRDVISGARALRALGATVILKGATSAICAEALYLSMSGSSGMAGAGSGDVLTGILGALLSQGLPPGKAAWLADELHGLAGERAKERFGVVSMTASDTAECLAEVFKLV
jgi:hydroxyethylthiazole kinase-like uncharacterized protein yjeF